MIKEYLSFAFKLADKKYLKDLKIILDSSGGSGGGLAEAVFGKLPIDAIKMNFRPRDKYPDHDLNPLLLKNRRSIQQEVNKQDADLGAIFDGDARPGHPDR